MSDIPFSYEDYVEAHTKLLELVNGSLTDTDREFLISFESGTPNWTLCCAGDLSNYPSVRWKLLNIEKLKKSNPKKFEQGLNKLRDYLKR